jgi:pyruvate dehydrogenase E2 component (dihydrolipoamide acetyltransferase)
VNAQVTMPALSPTMEKGTIAKWLVAAGEAVRPGTPIAEVETDKATMEVEAELEGVLLSILMPEGSEDVPVGTPIAVIGEAGSATEPLPPAAAPVAEVEPAPQATPPTPASVKPSAPPPVIAPAYVESSANASPLARRIAGGLGLDLSRITGTGSGGRIMKRDLGLVAPDPVAEPAVIASSPIDARAVAAPVDIPHEVVRLSSMRKTIAQRLSQSKQQVPHIYLSVDVRLDALLDLRRRINEQQEADAPRISINDMLIKALALSLVQVPACNTSFTGDALLQFRRVDISMAVAIPNGLVTPVIRGADSLSLSAIAAQSRRFAELARDGKLMPEDYQGGTASISNLGMMGIEQFSAIINPPQAMILAVGTAGKRPVVIDDAVAIATVMTITGSFDHRAVDGADAAAMMNAIRRLIEQPMRLLA